MVYRLTRYHISSSMHKIRVGVLCGGYSAERTISLVTGNAVFNNLDREKYHVAMIELTEKRQFVMVKPTKRVLDLHGKDRKKFDLIFIAMHGPGGEDGGMQGMLEVLGIPYTGSGVLASALGMDKVKSGELYQQHGLPHPDFVSFNSDDWKKDAPGLLQRIAREIKFPVVLKPSDQGSSVGVSFPKNSAELEKAINTTVRTFPHLLVQKFIRGREATCGVLESNGVPFALPPTRIIANLAESYDFDSKYAPGGSTHVCPADFGVSINKAIQKLAVLAHQALGCRGMSRTDVFVADNGALYIIETNTIPGMTPTSLLPEAAQKAGISFPAMLDLIVACSLR